MEDTSAAQLAAADDAEDAEVEAFSYPKPRQQASSADSAAAFSAAEVASAATAAVLAHGASAEALAARLVQPGGAGETWDRIALVHRLNEHFAACASFEAAEALGASLMQTAPKLGGVLVELMSDCDDLVELVAQLMHSLCVHPDGATMLAKAGALPVLTAMLRADEPLLRAQGLSLLVTLSEQEHLAKQLVRAGVLKLVTFLCKATVPARDGVRGDGGSSSSGSSSDTAGTSAPYWPSLLQIGEGLLRTPSAVPAVQRQQLRDVLAQAAFAHKAGKLPLELHDGRRLTRLLFTLRALALSDPPPGQRAQPRPGAKAVVVA